MGRVTHAIKRQKWEAIVRECNENGKPYNLEPAERLAKRKKYISPLVDDYFEWVKSNIRYVDKAFAYSLNQKKYLRTFLEDPNIGMDNNTAERAICPLLPAERTGL